MKFATQGRGVIFVICSAIVLLALPAVRQARSVEDSLQPANIRCDGCISKVIDLGPQAIGATAELLIPCNVPLDFSEIHVKYLPNGGIQRSGYVVRNDSQWGLVCLMVSWQTHIDDPDAPPSPGIDYISSWETGHAFLAPGASENVQFDSHFLPDKGHAVRRVTGIVAYAEFDDGTRLGPGVATLYPGLHARREKLLNDYQALLAMIRAGKPDPELDAYVQTTRGLEWLDAIRAQKGWNGVAAEISKRLQLIKQQARRSQASLRPLGNEVSTAP